MGGGDGRRRELIASLVLCVVGIAIMANSLQLRLGTLDEPGAGFFPFWSGTLIACLSFATGIMAWLGPSVEGVPWQHRASMPYFLVVVLLAYAFTLERLGFLLSTFLLLLILFRMMGAGRLVMAVAASAAASVVAYAVFRGALGLQLPPGVLGY